jgi:hypothetical protein
LSISLPARAKRRYTLEKAKSEKEAHGEFESVIDDVAKPIIREQYALLEKMPSQILDGNIDLKYTSRTRARTSRRLRSIRGCAGAPAGVGPEARGYRGL